MATTAKATTGGDVRGSPRNAPIALGAWLTMPAKMMKLMPLPMPRSVMSSPIHISVIGAGGQGGDLGQRLEAAEVERAGQDAAARSRQGQEAVGLQQRHRDGQVAGVLVDLVAPVLTFPAEGLEARARRPCISCMMIEALMYGFTPSATTEKFDSPPPENRLSSPNSGLPCEEARRAASGSTPGHRHVRPGTGRR